MAQMLASQRDSRFTGATWQGERGSDGHGAVVDGHAVPFFPRGCWQLLNLWAFRI